MAHLTISSSELQTVIKTGRMNVSEGESYDYRNMLGQIKIQLAWKPRK